MQCRYCNSLMQFYSDAVLGEDSTIKSWSWMFYRCKSCGSQGPTVKCTDIPKERRGSEDLSFTGGKEILDLRTAGRLYGAKMLESKLDILTRLGGMYSALKETDLPYAEQSVRRLIKERPTGRLPNETAESFQIRLGKWYAKYASALEHRRSLVNSLRSVIKDMRTVQNGIKEEKEKECQKS